MISYEFWNLCDMLWIQFVQYVAHFLSLRSRSASLISAVQNGQTFFFIDEAEAMYFKIQRGGNGCRVWVWDRNVSLNMRSKTQPYILVYDGSTVLLSSWGIYILTIKIQCVYNINSTTWVILDASWMLTSVLEFLFT